MDVLEMQGPTSVKGAIQEIAQMASPMSIIQGKVIAEKPLEIQVIGDEKLVLHENIMVIPRRFTDYEVKVDMELNDGEIESKTKPGQGMHAHGPSGAHGQYSGNGIHSHPAGEGEHQHELETFSIRKAKMKVYNSLKTGEVVYILSYNHGKKYLLLDREVSEE